MSLSKKKIAAIFPVILDLKLAVAQPYSSGNDGSVWLEGQHAIGDDQAMENFYSEHMSCLVTSEDTPNGFDGDYADIVQTPLVCVQSSPADSNAIKWE